jgi:hypothetical protein
MRVVVLVAVAALLAGCGPIVVNDDPPATLTRTGPTVRIVLVGDVMLGRGVASRIESTPDEVFAGVRHLIGGADLAAANLESPLTARPHIADSENALEADPASAALLAASGFDLVSLPNNHTGDAGPAGVLDTVAAVAEAGMLTVGAGPDTDAANAPVIVTTNGLRVGFLAFDATGAGLVAGAEAGVAEWDPVAGPTAIAHLAEQTDLVVVSVHGGAEYLTATDPGMRDIATAAAAAGADVVWGHGAHVVQPIIALPGTRPTVTATSLGNFLFDQSGTDRNTGDLLEIMADADGVIGYRVGTTVHPDRVVRFAGWQTPDGDAGWLDGSWWDLVRRPELRPDADPGLAEFRHGDVVTAGEGDVTGDGNPEIVASFRRPAATNPIKDLHPEVQWVDASGRAAHLGVYDPDGLTEIWVAGTVFSPIARLEVCDGSIAIVHDSLDDPTPTSTGAWTWNGFGFDTAPELPGAGTPACGDIDGDGSTEPLILRNSALG